MGDLVERLTVQAEVGILGMPDYLEIVSYKDCLAEITRLRAALADAQAVGFAAGVGAALEPCPQDDLVSDEKALLDLLEEQQEQP